jgi:vancomycin permeability regulator SanA
MNIKLPHNTVLFKNSRPAIIFFQTLFFLLVATPLLALLVWNLNSGQFFSDQSLKQIYSIVSEIKKNPRESVLLKFSDREVCLSAEIILHSFGIKNQQIKIIRIDQPPETSGQLDFLAPQKATPKKIKKLIIVLGSRALDESTPTVDLVQRVLKAIELFKATPGSLLLMTGGHTNGPISEARMLGLVAWVRGIDPQKILLEENSRTTVENARFTEELIRQLHFEEACLITRKDHLIRAHKIFQQYELFKNIQPVDSGSSLKTLIEQLEEYLKFSDNPEVRKRLKTTQKIYEKNKY